MIKNMYTYICPHTCVLHLDNYFWDLSAGAKTDYKRVAAFPNMMLAQTKRSVLINDLLRG